MPKYYRRRPYASKFKKLMGVGMNLASRYAFRRRGGGSYTRTQKRVTSGVGITAQHDSKVIYRKSYMPKYKKRQWGKFVKKVNAVVERRHGTKTVVLNDAASIIASAGLQEWNAYFLYGNNGSPANGASSVGQNDIATCVNRVTGSTSATTGSGERVHFCSGVLDLTLSHADTDVGPLEVDIYEMIFKKEPQHSTISGTIGDALTGTGTLTTGTALDLTQRGVTPFDIPAFLSSTGCKILKKTKYFMNQGQCVTYQMRDPRQRVVSKFEVRDYGIGSSDNASGYSSYIKAGWTRCLFVIHKTAPGYGGQAGTLSAGCTRKYKCVSIDNAIYQDTYN